MINDNNIFVENIVNMSFYKKNVLIALVIF